MINEFIKDDLLLINKPIDWTSNDVVQFIKRKFKFKKVGHSGTLDPKASGLMILGINDGTKKLHYLLHLDKSYSVKIKFHFSSNSYDMDSDKIKVGYNEKILNLTDINRSIAYFNDTSRDYWQIPPRYSAVKINGVRAYKLARKNQDFNIEPKLVKIYSIRNQKFNEKNQILEFDIECSSGFYIRSLVRDIGEYLGCSAILIFLKRNTIGKYKVEDSLSINDIKKINQ